MCVTRKRTYHRASICRRCSRSANTVGAEAFAGEFHASVRKATVKAFGSTLFNRHVAVDLHFEGQGAVGHRVGVAALTRPVSNRFVTGISNRASGVVEDKSVSRPTIMIRVTIAHAMAGHLWRNCQGPNAGTTKALVEVFEP